MASAQQLWYIYFFKNCRYAKPHPKDKLVVIVHIDNDLALGCFINTTRHPYLIENNLQHLAPEILCEEHPTTLGHDSFVVCQELLKFKIEELVAVREPVSIRAQKSILWAISSEDNDIERKYKRAILARDGHLLTL
jgi:hypothetical protein